MANKYPGYCTDCGREVRAGHGDLVKRGGKWVVSCGNKSKAAVTPKADKPKVVAPEGMRLTDQHISSSNAALNVTFSVNGLGRVSSFEPFQYGTAIKYTRWTGVLREGKPEEALAHDAVCTANEALHADLQGQGQIAYDSEHEFSFPLSAAEQQALSGLVESTKSAMLAAILDGSAEVRVGEVGCDFPHDQILGIKVAGQALEYALIQNVLRPLGLKVDGAKECKDLASAIRERQEAQVVRARKIAEHKERRAQGYHVVLMRRCWECGRTQILGELDDEMREVRMSPEVYAACVREQEHAHARSLATVPEGTILSSVGFDPAPESKFDFRIVESDWYCGC